MSVRKDICRDELYQLYIGENLTKQETASRLGVSETTIGRALHDFGIKKEKADIAKNVSKSLSFIDQERASQIQAKRRETCLAKYGVEYASSDPRVIAKRSRTMQERYGVDNAMRSAEFRKKNMESCIASYGVEHPAQNASVKDKMQTTCMLRYGVKNYGMSDDHRLKQMRTEIAKYHDDVDGIFDVLRSREHLERFIVDHDIHSVKVLSEMLDNYSVCRLDTLIGRYDLWQYFPHYISNGEDEVGDFIKSLGISFERTRAIISPYEIDVYCPAYRVGIEFNGTYFHSAQRVDRKYHYVKSRLAEQRGVRLIHIYQYEWENVRLRPIIMSVIKRAFGIVEHKIYARMCDVREVDQKQAEQFLDANHIQGYRAARVTYGLFY